MVPGLGPKEQESIQRATAVLDQWIPEDESFHDIQRVVGTILSAADRIGLQAAGGVPRLSLEAARDS